MKVISVASYVALREPDAQLGFVLGPFSMGQLLCLLMILAGATVYALRRK